MKLALFVNDIATEAHNYTTTRLAMTAVDRGHEVWYLGADDFSYDPDERIRARARRAPEKKRKSEAFMEALQDQEQEPLDVESLDVLSLRNDPAQDFVDRPWAQNVGVIFGRLAVRRGVLVVNDPSGLSKALNKLYFQQFPARIRPETLIGRDRQAIERFVADRDGYAVLKPLQGSGGQGVFLVRPDDVGNLNQMIDAVGRDGYVVAQEYLPAGADGDVRLFLVNGRPLKVDGEYAAFRRVRTGEDIRSNMHVGGKAETAKVDDAMLAIAEACRPRLIQDGMFFVGLDIVGDKLMEVNVFSPGGLNSLKGLTGVDFTPAIVGALERKLEFAAENEDGLSNAELATL
ncbi:MAG TPA: glutathione synthetase [Egibacteraceae bacterium]|nr:glutathione synthetase [Egibacteraceae bacterium]